MNEERVEAAKQKMIAGLKDDIENSMLENFVERYEEWKMKLTAVNAVIKHVDASVPLYEYNDFCKKIIEITKKSLEGVIEYDKLFLTSSEYFKIMQENAGDENKFEESLLKELNKKFTNNLMLVLNKEHLKESVRHKLGDKFAWVESELDKSVEMANSIIRKHEEETGL